MVNDDGFRDEAEAKACSMELEFLDKKLYAVKAGLQYSPGHHTSLLFYQSPPSFPQTPPPPPPPHLISHGGVGQVM